MSPQARIPARSTAARRIASPFLLLVGWAWFAACPTFAAAATPADDAVVLMLRTVPSDGLVAARVDLTAAAAARPELLADPAGLQAVGPGGESVPMQLILDASSGPRAATTGTIILKLPNPKLDRVRLLPGKAKPATVATPPAPWDGTIKTRFFTVVHKANAQGGLPSQITFADGRTVPLRWNDRLHHHERKGFNLSGDAQAEVRRIATGPLCEAVRVTARYLQSGKAPESAPKAVYDWFYFADRPVVYVTACVTQQSPLDWHETHVLELTYSTQQFPQWAGGDPPSHGKAVDRKHSTAFDRWGVVHDGRHALGMFSCGRAMLYDSGDNSYLQAHTDKAWRSWEGTQSDYTACLWFGASDRPADAVREAAEAFRKPESPTATLASLRERIEAAEARAAQTSNAASTPNAAPASTALYIAAAKELETRGRYAEAAAALDGRLPASWRLLESGDLQLIVETTAGGNSLVSLFDRRAGRSLIAAKPQSIFSITLHNTKTKKDRILTADSGWSIVQAETTDRGLVLRWRSPADKELGELTTEARATSDASGALRWRLHVDAPAAPWSLHQVVFPAVAAADLGPRTAVLYPKGSGQVSYDVWNTNVAASGRYPSGWTTMQYMAAYHEASRTGLYFGMHDPWGGTKTLKAEPRAADRSVLLAFEHPVPGMNQPGQAFDLCGEAVWQVVRGDWYDASRIYRDWVRKEAKWYPSLTADGREDTPRWMRELSVWCLESGPRETCVPAVRAFAKAFGAPAGVHWYNWHLNPFDNDYPHYFPTTPQFPDGVRELQTEGVSVMPYINGRLWDTRDRGAEDFQYTKVAMPATTKDENGKPFVETYGSKEKDGSKVSLGVMCPTTELWHKKVQEIVLRLFNECGVRGVYIDQIAAAAPALCCDASHGHPLGGGHWWTEGYWKMLADLRKAMPADRMLTTECNGEPYIRYFDGYLTWHWQYDGQVPAFSAIYGGSIQMFGRNFGGGDTRHTALRMKLGQALVYGEQLGWFPSHAGREKETFDFARQTVDLRRKLVRYFYAGEMARPPKLVGEMPTVRADWQWNGPCWVTTDAVLTGAWRQPHAKRLVLIFVNVSDKPVTAKLRYDAREAGLTGDSVRIVKITPTGEEAPSQSSPVLEREMTFPAYSASALEITP